MIQIPNNSNTILIWRTVGKKLCTPTVLVKNEDQHSGLVFSINDELLIDVGDLQSPL